MDEPLSIVLRSIAISLGLVLALAAFGLHRRGRWALLPMLLCLVAYLVRSSPAFAFGTLPAWLLPMAVGALLFPVAFWWLVHTAFEDRVDVPRTVWAGTALLLAAGLWPADAAMPRVVLQSIQKLVAAAFVVAALWRVWITAADDLVPRRRLVRGWLLAYAGLHGLAVLGVEMVLQGRPPPPWLDTLNVAAISLALSLAVVLLLRFDAAAAQMLFGDAAAAESPAIPEDRVVRRDDAADRPWIDRLEHLMAVEFVYRDPELSLAGLAARVGMPEYRLRELIHARLGHRNFPAYVNGYRLQEVERKLVDPGFDRRPILTLALEAGFGSIGPFNRAFRERHGVTPSAFRGARGARATPT